MCLLGPYILYYRYPYPQVCWHTHPHKNTHTHTPAYICRGAFNGNARKLKRTRYAYRERVNIYIYIYVCIVRSIVEWLMEWCRLVVYKTKCDPPTTSSEFPPSYTPYIPSYNTSLHLHTFYQTLAEPNTHLHTLRLSFD